MSSSPELFQEEFMETFSKEKKQSSEIEKLELESQQVILDYNRKVFNEILTENNSRPVKVLRVNVLGAGNNFRDNFLQRQLSPLLNNNEQLTLAEFLKNVDLTTENFTKTGTIKNIALGIASPQFKTPFTTLNTLEIVANLQIQPTKKFFMKIGTNVGNGEGDGYITLQWKNIFGGGELLNFDTNIASNQVGHSNKSQYLVSYSTPILNSPSYKFDTLLYHSSKFIDFTTHHEQIIKGLTFKIGTVKLPHEGKLNHELSFESLLRTIKISQTPNNYRNNSLVNDNFLFNAGDSMKYSITHAITKDSRDSQILPRKGSFYKLTNEVSLLPGSRFFKTALDMSHAYSINKNSILNVNFKGGILKSIENDLIHPMDKFQLGGANDIRGWIISGMGPKQMNLSIGGDVFFGIGTSLFSKIPFTAENSGFKLHFFTNAGKLTNLKKNENYLELSKRLFNEFNVSTGVGLVYEHPIARFELNWVIPLIAHSHDDLRKGLQWGIGISFL